jgi:hypothetical protein
LREDNRFDSGFGHHGAAGVAWIENGKRAELANAARKFGVRRTDGAWLSFDGVRPYAPAGGRRTAIEVAATIEIDNTT